MNLPLSGKKALITGGSQGIGRIIAHAIAKEGGHTVINCAHNIEKAQSVANEILAFGGAASIYPCDVSNEEAVEKMFDTLGKVDILVNNARVDPWLRQKDMSEGSWWDMVMDVNLKGCFLCSMAFFKRAKAYNYGRIINIASVRSFRPAEPSMIAYGVSKLGMHGISRAMAHNGAPFGITSNTICPGMVTTENIDKRLSKEKYQEECSAIPLGRPATSEEIAQAVLFVIHNGYVTGETININGGMYYAP